MTEQRFEPTEEELEKEVEETTETPTSKLTEAELAKDRERERLFKGRCDACWKKGMELGLDKDSAELRQAYEAMSRYGDVAMAEGIIDGLEKANAEAKLAQTKAGEEKIREAYRENPNDHKAYREYHELIRGKR